MPPALTFREALAKFNPDQPRVPAGQSGGGQWSAAAGAAAVASDIEAKYGTSPEQMPAGERNRHRRAVGYADRATQERYVDRILASPDRFLFHGSLADHAQSITSFGLIPQTGPFVEEFYRGDYPDWEEASEQGEAVYFAHAGDFDHVLTAMRQQVGMKLGTSMHEVGQAALIEHAALFVVRRTSGHESGLRQMREGDHHIMTIGGRRAEHEELPLFTEPGDWYSRESVVPDAMIDGPSLRRLLESSQSGEDAKWKRVRKFNPDQPRVPAGSAEGGEWVAAGGGGGGAVASDPRFGSADPWDWSTPQGGDGSQRALEERLKKLLPDHVSLNIARGQDKVYDGETGKPLPSLSDRTIARAAESAVKVIAEMHEAGEAIPGHIAFLQGQRGVDHISGEFSGAGFKKVVTFFLPPIPDDVSLDDAIATAYKGYDDNNPTVPRYVSRSWEDIVIHELGHVAHGSRNGYDAMDLRANSTAYNHVSKYAGKNGAEYVAEVFLKHHRGDWGVGGVEALSPVMEPWARLKGPTLRLPLATRRERAGRGRVAA